MRWLLIVLAVVVLARVGYYVAYERNPVPTAVAETFAKLRDKDPIERARAAQLLGQQGGSQVVAPLIAALKDADPSVRRNVASALGEIGPHAASAVPALVKAMTEDDDQSVRLISIHALGEIGPAASTELMIGVHSADEQLREASFRALESMGPEAACVMPDLIELLAAADPMVRQNAVHVLVAIGDESTPALRSQLANPNANVRIWTLQALGSLGTQASAAWPDVVTALADSEPKVREVAATVAPRVAAKPGDALPQLLAALKDPDASVRRAAATSLGALGPGGAAGVSELVKLLEQANQDDKPALAAAIGKIGPQAKAAVPALIAAMKESDGSLNPTTLEALGEIGPDAKDALPVLIAALDTAKSPDDVASNLSVILALGKIGAAVPDQASQSLLSALPKADVTIRPHVLHALADVGPASEEVAKALTASLNDENFEIAEAAAKALGRCGKSSSLTLPAFIEALQGKRFAGRPQSIIDPLVSYGDAAIPAVPALIAGLADSANWDDESRAAAAHALAVIAPTSAEASDALIKALFDPHGQERVRVAAATALAVFAPNSAAAANALKEAATAFSGPVQEAATKAREPASASGAKESP